MATCKDCLHHDACLRKEKNVIEGINRAFQYASEITNDKTEVCCSKRENICEFYKDISRFIELPKKGDAVYQVYPVNNSGDCAVEVSKVTDIIVDTNGVAFSIDLIGERFFLTREEAEAAKKEREGEA